MSAKSLQNTAKRLQIAAERSKTDPNLNSPASKPTGIETHRHLNHRGIIILLYSAGRGGEGKEPPQGGGAKAGNHRRAGGRRQGTTGIQIAAERSKTAPN